MTKIITITVEVYDGTTTDQIENIVGDALNNNGNDCTYDVNERGVDQNESNNTK